MSDSRIDKLLLETASKIAREYGVPDEDSVSFVLGELNNLIESIKKLPKPSTDPILLLPPVSDGTPFQYREWTGVLIPVKSPTDMWTFYDATKKEYKLFLVDITDTYFHFYEALKIHDWNMSQIIWDQIVLEQKETLCDGVVSDLALTDVEVAEWLLNHGVRPLKDNTIENYNAFKKQFKREEK